MKWPLIMTLCEAPTVPDNKYFEISKAPGASSSLTSWVPTAYQNASLPHLPGLQDITCSSVA